MNLDEYVAQLAPLESFDAAAFAPSDRYPQALCDFVLSMALAFNDLKGVLMADEMLLGFESLGDKTAKSLHCVGLWVQVVRSEAAVLHELMNLIAANDQVVKSPAFRQIVRGLSPACRTAWQAVVDVAQAKPATSKLSRFLLLARNKVAFHYDPKPIAAGFRTAFGSGDDVALLSRGNSLRSSRFYFADASAAAYLDQLAAGDNDWLLQSTSMELVGTVAFALDRLVTQFINMRGFAYRSEAG